MGATLSFPVPRHHHPTPRALAHTMSLVLVCSESVPSPLGRHVLGPLSVSVSYFFLSVSCLPKMTSLRWGDGRARCSFRPSADLKCQVSSAKGIRIAGEGFITVHIVPCPLGVPGFSMSLRSPFGPSCTDVTTWTLPSVRSAERGDHGAILESLR